MTKVTAEKLTEKVRNTTMKNCAKIIIISFLSLFIGCTNSYNVILPNDDKESTKNISRINYLGSKYNSIIAFTTEIEVEAQWINISENELLYILNDQTDTLKVELSALNYIKIQDKGSGTMEGIWLGLVLGGLWAGSSSIISNESEKGIGQGVAALLGLGIGIALGISEGGIKIYYFNPAGNISTSKN